MNSDSQVTHSDDVTKKIFRQELPVVRGVYIAAQSKAFENQSQTNNAFSEKWKAIAQKQQDQEEPWKVAQLQWYFQLYGFQNEQELARFVEKKV